VDDETFEMIGFSTPKADHLDHLDHLARSKKDLKIIFNTSSEPKDGDLKLRKLLESGS
jgi:hypothetical protein